jgi:copper(I)-binding protein
MAIDTVSKIAGEFLAAGRMGRLFRASPASLSRLAVLCSAVLCSAVLSGAVALPAAAAQPVDISAPWSRATLPHQDVGVAYMTLRSAAGDVLTGATTSDAGMAMLHQSTKHGAMAGMEDVDNIPLPAGQTVTLGPDGTHIMLMDLKHPLKAGDTLHLTLHFARSGDQDVAVPVRPWKN